MANRIICHGDHGAKPKFEGDTWTAWFLCSECRKHIGLDDRFCKHCGAELEGNVNDEDA